MIDSSGSAVRKRRRPPLACESCRRRKLRCDRNAPCNQCAKSKNASCTYVPIGEPERITKDAPTPVLDHEPVVWTHPSLPPVAGASNAKAQSRSVATWIGPDSPISQLMTVPENSLAPPPPADGHSQAAQSMLHNIVQPEQGCTTTDQPDLRTRASFSKTRFFGQTHWANAVSQFKALWAVAVGVEKDKSSELFFLMSECKNYVKLIKTHFVPRHSYPNFRDLVPPKETADRLYDAYLRTYETVFRIFHVPSLHEEYQEYWNDPKSAHSGFVIQLLLVMAIGSCFQQDPLNDSHFRTLSLQWIYAAQAWLSSPHEKSRINTSGLQTQCLLLLARHACAVSGELVWISAGSLLRTAMMMGFHRDPKHLPKIPSLHAEVRRRLWATVLEICIQSCMDSGGPPLISEDDFDCEMPSNIHDDQLSETCRSPSSHSNDTFTDTTIQIELMHLLPIRLKIANYLNHIRSRLSYKETLQLSSDLLSGIRSSLLKLQSPHCSDFQRRFFTLLTQRFVMDLHLPFAILAKSNQVYHFSRKANLDSSICLLKCAMDTPSLDYSRNEVSDFARLISVGGGILRNIPMVSGFCVCIELMSQIEEESLYFAPGTHSESHKQLRQLIEQHVTLIEARIRLRETNCKGFLAWSALLAQIDAMEQGKPIQEEVSLAVKKALLTSLTIFAERSQEVASENVIGLTLDQKGLGYGSEETRSEEDYLMQDLGFDIDPIASLLGNDWLQAGDGEIWR